MTTMKLINSVTVGAGGASSISFTSIPSTYTDLKLVFSLRTSVSGNEDATIIQFNGSSTGYTERIFYGTGNNKGGTGRTGNAGIQDVYANGNTATASSFSSSQMYIPSYTSSNYKIMSFDSATERDATVAYYFMGTGMWANTSAITSIGITPATASTTFSQHTIVSLYGIKTS